MIFPIKMLVFTALSTLLLRFITGLNWFMSFSISVIIVSISSLIALLIVKKIKEKK